MLKDAPRDVDAWLWLQRLLGLSSLAAFAVFHLWVHWAALFGREYWRDRAQLFAPGTAAGCVIVTLFVAHATVWIARGVRGERRAGAQDYFELGLSVLVAAFLVIHLMHVWPRPDGSSATLEHSYQLLWDLLGRPLTMACYVLGCGALCCYLALGLMRVLVARLPDALRSVVRVAVAVLGVVLFIAYLQLIARFAAGAALLPYAALPRDAAHSMLLQSPHASDAGGVRQYVS